MICFENVTVSGDNGVIIIEDISFSVKEGEKIVFFGKSGSGKTTILAAIVGAHIPVKGTVYFAGEKITNKNISKLRQSVSFIGQEPLLCADRVMDALLLPYTYRANRGQLPSRQEIDVVFRKLHLEPAILNKSTSVVSGGEKQRIAIARAILQNKTIFIVDEITSALDMESKKVVLDMFNKDGHTLISASHDPDWLEICSRSIKIDKGKIIATDTSFLSAS